MEGHVDGTNKNKCDRRDNINILQLGYSMKQITGDAGTKILFSLRARRKEEEVYFRPAITVNGI